MVHPQINVYSANFYKKNIVYTEEKGKRVVAGFCKSQFRTVFDVEYSLYTDMLYINLHRMTGSNERYHLQYQKCVLVNFFNVHTAERFA